MQQRFPKKYEHIYFDLDNTLWDFKSNSETTLYELMEAYFPGKKEMIKKFLSVYYPLNDKLWLLYRKGVISKETLRNKRFIDSFKQIGIYDEDKAIAFGEDYIAKSPYQTGLFPYALETLHYLKNKGYKLYLLTNGFIEVQVIKITQSGIEAYIDKMITSEDAGYQKPHRKIFEYALKSANARKKDSIMIGDDLVTDIAGARKFGMDRIFFNPEGIKHSERVNFEIRSLKDLQLIL